ncbi:hypothetical protein ACH3Y9_04955 [Streptomyces sp. WSLK1-5]|uniref:hypothetical protein n=1 Tax=unclassified Streptomyces TaxID=2593676 RepID=UPI00378E312C
MAERRNERGHPLIALIRHSFATVLHTQRHLALVEDEQELHSWLTAIGTLTSA